MSNLCLKYVEVAFYQISRSLGIPMVPLIRYSLDPSITHSYLLFGERTTLRTVISCFSVVIGYIAGVDGEINFSLRGTLFGVGASAVGTFYTIYLKRYLSNVVDNSYLLTFYTNFNSCIILPFLCLFTGEIPTIWEHRSDLTFSYFFWIFVCKIWFVMLKCSWPCWTLGWTYDLHSNSIHKQFISQHLRCYEELYSSKFHAIQPF